MSVQVIVNTLLERGFHAFFVGGYVRDSLFGVPSHDIDIATNASPNQIESIFKNIFPIKTVGKSFGVVIVNGIEVATFRTDNYAGLNHKNVEINHAKTIEEDLSRRDFTINAMAIDCHSRELIDPFDGQLDLEFRTIRFVGNPVDRILEDPNRILRACRFVAQLNGKLDTDTKHAIQRNLALMRYVAPERIRLEILKAMKSRYASKFFVTLMETGLLGAVFPSLLRCVNHVGGNYHPETVFDHLMNTGDSISVRCPLTKLAGYLHDVGKPVTYSAETGQFLEHEKFGANILEKELSLLKFSNKEIRYVTELVKLHMRSVTVLTDKGIRKLIRKLQTAGISYRDFLRLYIADRNANTGLLPLSTQEIRYLIDTVENQMTIEYGITGVKDLKVSGYDVMNITGFKPGPNIGKILDYLLDLVMVDPMLNTKEKLTEILHSYCE
jgi:putative nucleotidyltransferase with HDIG domain